MLDLRKLEKNTENSQSHSLPVLLLLVAFANIRTVLKFLFLSIWHDQAEENLVERRSVKPSVFSD